jgi:hypothetical protein
VVLLAIAPAVAGAEWLQPDPSYREAQLALRLAVRDTVGWQVHQGPLTGAARRERAARLDSVGAALLRLADLPGAESVLRRALALDPEDRLALAGLGKIALFRGRLEEARELLLAPALGFARSATSATTSDDTQVVAREVLVTRDLATARDLVALHVRLGNYEHAATSAAWAEESGWGSLYDSLAASPPYRFATPPSLATVPWTRAYPIPLVRVKLNGQSVLMAIDTGASDLLIDESAARRCKVRALPAQRLEFWSGTRFAVQNAIVDRLELGGLRIERLPAGTLSLRKWSIEVNPHAEQVAGVIGLGLLRRFTPTLDYKALRLELRPLEAAPRFAPGTQRVPFEIWGTSELTVRASLAGGRRMAMVVQTGVPGCGVGAPPEVFEEIGVRAGAVSRLVRGAGSWLQGRGWTQVTVPSVSLGGVIADRVPGWSGALDSSELWRHGVRRDALLSHDFFRGRRMTIDWKASELVFEP